MSKTCQALLALLLAVILCPAPVRAQSAPAAIRLVPSDAIVCVEVSRPRDLLELITGEAMAEAVASLPFYQELSSGAGFTELRAGITFMEVSLDMPWREALKKLTGGGITFALCPNDIALWIIDAEDGRLLKRSHEVLLAAMRADAQSKGRPFSVETAEFMGVRGWSSNGRNAHAIIGNRLIFSNRVEGLKRALELRTASDGVSFAARGDYRQAQADAGAAPPARAFLNIVPFKAVPGLAKLLEQDKSNPLAALFFSGITEAVRKANWLWMGLGVGDHGLTLRALLDGQVTGRDTAAAFAQPARSEEGAMPNLLVPRRIASLSFYRDLYGFYSAKDDLFPERTSQLIFFENMMGIFFTGRDLTSEVLIETEPEIRFVVAQDEPEPARDPGEKQMPAFAVVFRLRDAENFDMVVEEAWQKAIGLVNFTQGQQAMPGLIIERPVYHGVKFTVAGLSTAGLDNPNAHHNYRPTLAMPGDYLVLSSTDGLARDLIDALTAEAANPRKPLAGIHSRVELDGEALASILRANEAGLVRQNMVEKGSTREEAEEELRLYLALTGMIHKADLVVGTRNGRTEARLGIELARKQPPSPGNYLSSR